MNIEIIVIFIFFSLSSSEYIEKVNKIDNQDFANKTMPELLDLLPLFNEVNKIKAFQELINRYSQSNSFDSDIFEVCLLKVALYGKQPVVSEFLTSLSKYKFEDDISDLSLLLRQLTDRNLGEDNTDLLNDIVDESYERDFIGILKYLINNNSINIEDKLPLHLTAAAGNLDLLKFHLKNGAFIDERDDSGNTPLYVACANGHFDIVDYLIKNKADINITDEEGGSPLHVAIYKKYLDIAKFLIDNGANIYKRTIIGGVDAFGLACVVNDVEFAKYLFDKGCNINTFYKDDTIILHPVHIACYHKNMDMVKFLMDTGSDINAKGYLDLRPLNISCRRLDLDIIKFLVNNKADIKFTDFSGNNLLHEACRESDLDIIKYFINKCPELIKSKNKAGEYAFDLLPKDLRERSALQEIFYTLEKAIINSDIELSYKYFGKKIDPILVDTFLLQKSIKLYSPQISYYLDNTYFEVRDIESTHSKFNIIKNKIFIIIKIGSVNDIKKLKNFHIFFSRLQMANLLVELINLSRYNQKKLIALIKRVSLDFNLSQLLDRHGKNLLWHALNKNDIYLSAILIMLCNSLLSENSYENFIGSFVNISKLILKPKK